CAYRSALVEVDHVLIGHADAARGYRSPDRPWLIGAVDTIERGAEIQRPCPHRVVGSPFHEFRQAGLTGVHFGRRRPAWPLALSCDPVRAAPFETQARHADAITYGLAAREHQIQIMPLG